MEHFHTLQRNVLAGREAEAVDDYDFYIVHRREVYLDKVYWEEGEGDYDGRDCDCYKAVEAHFQAGQEEAGVVGDCACRIHERLHTLGDCMQN